MAKAKKRSGRKKGKQTVRGKRASTGAKRKATDKRIRAAKPRSRSTQGVTAGVTQTAVAVPGAWPFPMLSKP